MKNVFTRTGYAIAMAILLFVSPFSAGAQYTSKIIAANAYASAIAKDNSGNIYVMEAISHGSSSNAQILKYTNGTGTPTTIYNGSLIQDLVSGTVNDYAFGLAVTGNGDIYATTANDYGNSFYGNIIKLTNNSGTYTGSVFKAGNTNNGAFASLAVDASDNLYCVEYNVAGNGGASTNGIPGAYEVVKYPATAGVPSTSGSTVLYDKLELSAFASASTYSAITGLAIDNATGTIFVADNFNNGILPSPDGGHVYKLTKSGSTYTPSTFSTNTFASALSMDASGNLYALIGNASNANFTLVEYVGATGSPVTLIPTGTFTASGGFYPFGLIAINKNNIFATNGAALGDFMRLTGPPTTQATNVNFTNVYTVSGTTATVNWTNGDGAARAVFIKQATTGSPALANNTTYSPNAAYGTAGSQVGATGWYCIYTGLAATANVTGLTAGQTYRVMVMEYNGVAAGENYLQTTATNNPNNVSPLALTTINSINRVSSATTNAASVSYTATFGASVTGLSTTNFSLTATGTISGASVTSVTGSGTTYTVAVNTGTGNGNITLNLANATNLIPGLTSTLPFAGQPYSIYKATNTNDHFRTKNTIGDWATASDWESSPDNSFFITATAAPSGTATDITIQTGHTIAISAAQTASAIAMSGMININSQTLTVSGAITGAGSGKYIKTNGGILKMNVANAATKIFPVGNSDYNPLSITNNTGAADDFSVQVSDEVVGASGHTITQPHIKRTWDIAKTSANGGSGINLVFNWNSGENNAVATPALYHFVSPLWVRQTGTTSSTATSLTYTGYTGTFSPFAIGDAAVPLPLNLLSFTGAMQPSGAALLQWQTARETNTAYFGIDRSFDGKDFTEIGRQDATNNASAISNYSFTDQNTGAQHSSSGRRYYRLKLIDLNGNFTYSNILSIDNYVSSTDDISVFPNPVTDHLSFRVNDWTQVKEITLTDNAGKILTRSTTPVNDLSMGCYPGGIYHLSVLKTNGEIISKQVVKGR